MSIKLGSNVRDKITGFSGVVTGAAQYITGCEQFLVQPPIKDDSEFREPRWFDEDRLSLASHHITELNVTKAGPNLAAPRK